MTNKEKMKMLIGQTIIKFVGKKGSDEIVLSLADRRKFKMCHVQSCYETVLVEDICGDIADLIGSPLVQAEETTNRKYKKGYKRDATYDSRTWTFYRFATAKGAVTIRWLGESTGPYSETVDLGWKRGATFDFS
jgi:hypothetical protein